ncbi:MAG: energy-coupling factor transporter ATPase [Treponema sp.]|nr:energy-coupling factor transporter ATPase [Treponema sp.]
MSIVEFAGVCFVYPRTDEFALEGINLSVNEGEFLAIMGENGAGKTTFCKLVNGIIPHLSGGRLTGNVTVDGIKTIDTAVPDLAYKVGMVFDDPDAQLFTSTVRHEAAFGPENILLPPEEINKRVQSALCAAGLSGFEDRLPSTLSGGEKQRLSIAAALAMKSKILVLDEPLCRLDPNGAREVLTILEKLKTENHLTIIMAAHNTVEMAKYADRVCLLKNGRVAAIDTARNIFADDSLLEQNGIQPLNLIKKFSHQGFAGYYKERENFPVNALRNPKLSEAQSSAVNIKDFNYDYPNGISIKNINLSIAENDFTAIIGGNGCGKTTLLKNITGLLRPSSGEIFIRGRNIKELNVCGISKEAGFVMQNPDTQLFTDSVYKEVSFALKNINLPKTQIKQRAEESLQTVGLNDPEAFPHALSKADRTKLVIACVLAMGCRIIILDEIDVGLDYKDCLKIMNIARDLHLKGFTIIFVTHNMFLACEYAHRLIKMNRDGIEEIISEAEGAV